MDTGKKIKRQYETHLAEHSCTLLGGKTVADKATRVKTLTFISNQKPLLRKTSPPECAPDTGRHFGWIRRKFMREERLWNNLVLVWSVHWDP